VTDPEETLALYWGYRRDTHPTTGEVAQNGLAGPFLTPEEAQAWLTNWPTPRYDTEAKILRLDVPVVDTATIPATEVTHHG
jgi:hypothetical protein